jgi:hypothetical protein
VEVQQGLAQVDSLFLGLGEQRVFVARGEPVQWVRGIRTVAVQLK